MIPCAEDNYVPSAWFFREAIMSLMHQDNITHQEVAARLGVHERSIRRYLTMNHHEAKNAVPQQYPQQFLIELMLNEDTSFRLMQSLPWRKNRRAK